MPGGGGLGLQSDCSTFAGEFFVPFGCNKRALLAQLLSSWEGPEGRGGNGPGSNYPWEISPGPVGASQLLLGHSVKGDKFK